MILLMISLVLDVFLFAIVILKGKNILQPLRFAAFSSVVNLLAYCVAYGLTESFSKNILFDIICTVAAKIFIFYIFSTFRRNVKIKSPSAYLMVFAVSLCVYSIPLSGVICGIVFLVYLLYIEYSGKDEAENKNDTTTINENSLYLRTIEGNYRKSRELWHDLNNHILSMRSLAENKLHDELEIYINSLSEKIASNAFPIKSGNIVLDALIADKYQRARKAEIYLEFESIDYRNAINDEDLCVIIGNLFDNAIEENLRSIDKNERYIKLYISSKDDMLIIRLKNPLYHELSIKSGLPSTIKPDASHHGMGLKNVRRICDKYNGELLWASENNIFEIIVRLNITSNPSILTSAKNQTNYMI